MKLSNYEIGKTIGEGAYAKVKLGKHLPSGEKVAIKIIDKMKLKEAEDRKKEDYDQEDEIMLRKARKKIYNDALKHIKMDPELTDEQNELNLVQFIDRVKKESNRINLFEEEPLVSESLSSFQKEVLLMMRFNHPNIIKIFKVIESKSDLYIVMAYAPNGDLASLVAKQGYLTEPEARRIFRQIVSGLDFIHSSKVVHRDLKMENILLDQNSNALITDFGLGRSFQNSDYMRTSCGTPNYSSPEMISGKPYSGTKTDIWSMGVILYAMVTGTLPFDGNSVKSVFKKITLVEYVIPPNLSWELSSLIKMILVGNPDKRYDLDTIREDRWINMGYIVPPEHVVPIQNTNENLGKVISSVTCDDQSTIYNINHHKLLVAPKSPDGLEKTKRDSVSNPPNRIKRSSSVSNPNSAAVKVSCAINSPMETVFSDNQLAVEETKSVSSANTKRKESFCEEKFSRLPNRDCISQTAANSCKNCRKELQLLSRQRSSTCSRVVRVNNMNKNQKNASPEQSRELSVLNRMSNDSDKSFPNDAELNFEEIRDWHWIHKPPIRIRTMKFNFKKGLYSSLDPPVLFQDLHRGLVQLKELFNMKISKLDGYYLFRVDTDNCAFDIELCKIWLLNMHGLKISKQKQNQDFINHLVQVLAW
ncbi:hypothetical protein HDV06_006934 [Boothiomyces sp. JEL0866]|nr:hypothetical protein HDV06_006934 [Boothiomyces sp. JEL0866]